MATKAVLNPFIGREQDVLSMCKHFLEDNKVRDNPVKYHKKLAILTISVMLLKHLYEDDLDLEHLIGFLTKKEVMERDLGELELRGSKTDWEAAEWFKGHLLNPNEEYDLIITELARELGKLPQ